MTEGELAQKYLDFKESFPKLFDMAIQAVSNDSVQKTLEIFEMMLSKRQDQKDGVNSKNITDMAVGNQLGKEFIYPKTGGPTQEEYNKAVKKIKKGNAMKELNKSLG